MRISSSKSSRMDHYSLCFRSWPIERTSFTSEKGRILPCTRFTLIVCLNHTLGICQIALHNDIWVFRCQLHKYTYTIPTIELTPTVDQVCPRKSFSIIVKSISTHTFYLGFYQYISHTILNVNYFPILTHKHEKLDTVKCETI